MRRVVEKEFCGSRRAALGRVGIDLRVSCVLCWLLLKVRMGLWRLSLSLC